MKKKSWILAALRHDAQRREAAGDDAADAVLSLDEQIQRVSDALRMRFGKKSASGDYDYSVYALQTFDDYVVYRNNGKTFEIAFEWGPDFTVQFTGEPGEVVQRWTPLTAKEAFAETVERDATHGDRITIEAQVLGPRVAEGDAPAGRVWDVLLIREGMSKNRNRYQRKVLADAAPLYENRPMFVDHKLETGPYGRSGNEAVGFTKNVRPVVLTEGEGKEATAAVALAAQACLIDEDFAGKLAAAHALGNPTLFGLSHDVRAESVTATSEDGPFYDVTAIRKVESTDWVLTPAAGGRVLRLVASDTPHPQLQEDARMLKELIEALKAAGVTVPDQCDEATAKRLLTEALRTARTSAAVDAGVTARQETQTGAAATTGQPAAAAATTTPAAAATREAVTQTSGADDTAALRQRVEALSAQVTSGGRVIASLALERNLLECSLPDVFKSRLRARFSKQISEGAIPTEDAIVAAIKECVEDVGALREANIVMPHVGTPRVEFVKDKSKKVQEHLDEFFDPKKGGRSFKEIYIQITGDAQVTGKITEDVRARLSECGQFREGLNTGSFDQILGDSITRRMLKDYADAGLAEWRGSIAEVVPLNDFRTVRRLRFGGYGNLPIVGQGGAYTALTSPTDEEATYSPAKRGGTESLTVEMIKNDDVGAIRRIPSKLGRAAAQTLHEFVWDFLNTNANIYDAVALAASGHNNIVTTAMSGANISALRLKLKQQTDMSNGKRLGLTPKTLIVPGELEELAFQLTTSDRVLGSNFNDPNFVKKIQLATIVVEYWTDTNNYWVTASVDQAPMIEVGFLDGQENPELMVQDMPNIGSMFSNDELTYKVRHVYGGAVMDYRPFAAGIVP